MERLLVLLLGLVFASFLRAGGMDLTVPDSPTEAEKPPSDNAPCKGCGVVANVRQLAPAADKTPSAPDSPYLITLGEAKRQPEGNLDMSGARINTWEEWPKGGWQITVRYNDGSYAFFNEETQPSLEKGDRVQVISGKVVPR